MFITFFVVILDAGLGLGSGFAGHSGFLHHSQLASLDLVAMWQKKRQKI